MKEIFILLAIIFTPFLEQSEDTSLLDIRKLFYQASEESEEQQQAEATAEEAVEEVLQETEIKTEVPVSTAANEPTVYEKYKAAFSMDGFDIKHR